MEEGSILLDVGVIWNLQNNQLQKVNISARLLAEWHASASWANQCAQSSGSSLEWIPRMIGETERNKRKGEAWKQNVQTLQDLVRKKHAWESISGKYSQKSTGLEWTANINCVLAVTAQWLSASPEYMWAWVPFPVREKKMLTRNTVLLTRKVDP